MTLEAILRVFRAHGDHRQRACIRRLAKADLPAVKALATGAYPPSVQRWAVEALGRFPEKLAWPTVSRALRSPHMSVRLHALLAVRGFGNPRRAAALRPLLRDESGGVRINALPVVAGFRPKWLGVELKRALRDEKFYVRREARRLMEMPCTV